jgi:hypothetical protein
VGLDPARETSFALVLNLQAVQTDSAFWHSLPISPKIAKVAKEFGHPLAVLHSPFFAERIATKANYHVQENKKGAHFN